MKIRIDYLNKQKQPKHIFTEAPQITTGIYETDIIGFEIVKILDKGATDVRVYNI